MSTAAKQTGAPEGGLARSALFPPERGTTPTVGGAPFRAVKQRGEVAHLITAKPNKPRASAQAGVECWSHEINGKTSRLRPARSARPQTSGRTTRADSDPRGARQEGQEDGKTRGSVAADGDALGRNDAQRDAHRPGELRRGIVPLPPDGIKCLCQIFCRKFVKTLDFVATM